jgi:hypothetical protein
MQQFYAAVKTGESSIHLIDLGAANAHTSVRTQTQSSIDDCHQASGRTLMAQYEVKRAEAEASVEVFRGQPSLAVPFAMPVTEINANTLSGAIRPL